MTTGPLSNEDVAKLLSDPSPNARMEAATKIATDFNRDSLSDKERGIAEDIFRIMLNDAEVRVREALAVNLKENVALPHDVALALANDVSSVSLPILTFSEVLSDSDLIEIISTQNEEKQIAISGRPQVSQSVSSSLVNTGRENVVSTLVANEGADISEAAFAQAVDQLGDSEKVQQAMVGRSSLPISITEKLVTRVSDALRMELMKRHDLTADTAADLLLQSRERATVTLSTESANANVVKLVKQLHQNGRLTSSIILRALCMGDFRFFECALSELAEIPLINARTLIHDPGKTGLRRLWLASKMPEPQLVAVYAAIQAASELEYDGEPNDRQRFSRKLIELILTQYDDLGVEFESDDLEYLLTKMSRLPASLKNHE